MADSGTKRAWVIHENKAVQIHVHHSNRRCLYVPRVPGSVKNPAQQQQRLNPSTTTSNCQPFRFIDPEYRYKFIYFMANSADPVQLIWIYTVCKGRVYPGSAEQRLR